MRKKVNMQYTGGGGCGQPPIGKANPFIERQSLKTQRKGGGLRSTRLKVGIPVQTLSTLVADRYIHVEM